MALVLQLVRSLLDSFDRDTIGETTLVGFFLYIGLMMVTLWTTAIIFDIWYGTAGLPH